MKLRHYSNQKFVGPVRSSRQRFNDFEHTGGKPRGFWISVEDDPQSGWKGWCEGEDFRLSGLAYHHKVTLVPDANILIIRTADELDAFTWKYKTDSEINGHEYPSFTGGKTSRFIYDINWKKLAEEYDGIFITPYIWSRRLEPHCTWYYGWDCASGCIWNAQAIESVKLVYTNTKYVGRREKTHSELMADMQASVEKLGETIPEFKKLADSFPGKKITNVRLRKDLMRKLKDNEAGAAYGCLYMQNGEKWPKVEEQIRNVSEQEPAIWFFDFICTKNQLPTAAQWAEDVTALIKQLNPTMPADNVVVGVCHRDEDRPARSLLTRFMDEHNGAVSEGVNLKTGRRFLWINGVPQK